MFRSVVEVERADDVTRCGHEWGVVEGSIFGAGARNVMLAGLALYSTVQYTDESRESAL